MYTLTDALFGTPAPTPATAAEADQLVAVADQLFKLNLACAGLHSGSNRNADGTINEAVDQAMLAAWTPQVEAIHATGEAHQAPDDEWRWR